MQGFRVSGFRGYMDLTVEGLRNQFGVRVGSGCKKVIVKATLIRLAKGLNSGDLSLRGIRVGSYACTGSAADLLSHAILHTHGHTDVHTQIHTCMHACIHT